MNDTKTIELKPNYEAIFRHMMDDATRQGQASEMFASLMTQDTATALRDVQRWFAPLTLAVNAASTVAEIQQVREVMADILADIDSAAQRIENGLAGDGEENE